MLSRAKIKCEVCAKVGAPGIFAQNGQHGEGNTAWAKQGKNAESLLKKIDKHSVATGLATKKSQHRDHVLVTIDHTAVYIDNRSCVTAHQHNIGHSVP